MALAQTIDYSVSPPLTGDAVINRLDLTGWSSVLTTKTTQGRVWWTLSGSALTIYSDEGKTASIGTATLTTNTDATISAANSSGITGTINATFTQSSTGVVVISYANEADLEAVFSSSTSVLTSSNWAGTNRFELAFRIAKRRIDEMIVPPGDAEGAMYRGRLDLTQLSDPRQLSEAHAYMTAFAICQKMASIDPTSGYRELANDFRKESERLFSKLVLRWDTTRDGQTDDRVARWGSGGVLRG